MIGPSEPTHRSHRTIGAFVVMLCVIWIMIAVYVADANLPYNALTLPLQDQLDLRIAMPEGWAFFTKDPRAERVLTFRKEGDGWANASRGPQSSLRHLWGINRSARAQGVETGLLMHRIPADQWRKCTHDPATCLDADAFAGYPKANATPRPTLCGDVAIVLQSPLPWAWSRSSRVTVMPSRFIKLRIKC